MGEVIMALIMDYLDWRGDLRFDADPFNEVDSYILSKFGCPDYTGIIFSDIEQLSLSVAVEQYFSLHGEEGSYLGALASPSIAPVIRRLPELPRYRGIQVAGFVNRIDVEVQEQFSALTLLLPDGAAYISFRGTDDTLLGWKENMMMSVKDVIPAQSDALHYLEWAADAFSGPLIVGGHSKGGNLAVFAATMASPEIQERITAVYNFDGPGFPSTFFQQPGYQVIRSKIQTFLPQYSIVGMILPREEDVTIVESSRAGIAAHDGFLWNVKGPRFVRCENFSRGTLAFESSMRTILDGMERDSRIAFINELFDTLSSTGAATLTDVTELHTRQALVLGRDIYQKPEVHRFVTALIELMIRDYALERGKE